MHKYCRFYDKPFNTFDNYSILKTIDVGLNVGGREGKPLQIMVWVKYCIIFFLLYMYMYQ